MRARPVAIAAAAVRGAWLPARLRGRPPSAAAGPFSFETP